MSKLVTIYGGSGFVGRYIARRMAKAGWRVRVAVRRPNEAMFVKTYGAVGQVEPVLCNVRDDASVAAVMQGADAVVNCVGILTETRRNKFDAVQHEAAERVARIAADQGVKSLVHLSSIGASTEAESEYSRTKGLGEAGILKHFPSATILRPSVIFGSEDEFVNKFASMSRLGPVMAIVGGDTTFQPVHVDDVAEAVEVALNKNLSGVYELGGPEVLSLRAIVGKILECAHRRRIVLNLPFFVGSILGGVFGLLQALTLGMFHNSILTRDQVKSLKHDNVVDAGAKGFADLGIKPTSLDAVIPSYVWRYRPSGQYDDIRDSAKNIKA
ncbi:complex I NDUFA9 subunit family protein [Falsihalocynthiibacter sp. SS001]|uniref:complex I NDUFA9 subunit family protein n=1 Tax=Falsihalocynthiibacter sp. SS001 TaxID=3349698 RepID=UPI0036D3A15C